MRQLLIRMAMEKCASEVMNAIIRGALHESKNIIKPITERNEFIHENQKRINDAWQSHFNAYPHHILGVPKNEENIVMGVAKDIKRKKDFTDIAISLQNSQMNLPKNNPINISNKPRLKKNLK